MRSRPHTFRIAVAVLCASAVALAGCGDDDSAGTGSDGERRTLNVLSLTGTTGDLIQEVFEPFEQQYNVEINWVTGASAENLARMAATKANPEYDNAILDDLSAYTASSQGMLAKVDESIVTELPNMFDAARTPNGDGVAWGAAITGIFYNTEALSERGVTPPAAWDDLLKPELCEGIGMASLSGSSTLKAVMMLGGMSRDGANTDAAVKAGLEKLKSISSCVQTFEASVGAVDAKIQSGAYSHGIQPSTAILRAKNDGLPLEFVVPEPGSVGVLTTVVPIKDAPNAELSQQFVNWLLTPDVQRQLSERAFYSPLNRNVQLDQRLLDLGVPGPEVVNELYTPDYAVVTSERPAWSSIFDREVAGK
ncbi:extracellular solute-binding protein [Solwaraspora sp. WMMD1047]|uniref:extracellular solute-binding protein n=1 Tax=Solwaraspora sp. WMMD1047 TaxID=3016102 RepID=UPI0024159BF2|nr:extracellular solute-binding protein [Solwaraspora sp. WMMD1047]MDG4834323.1 extracellular solute-binding protein [Solwaraspora sp. WMMD1047]